MEHEQWLDVRGFEGFYQVSNLGRVRSLPRATTRGKILKGAGRPYLGVRLTANGRYFSRRVHRLVAEAFVPNPDNLPVVDHIDGNKLNNRADNLRWCTHRQNTLYAMELGTVTGGIGYWDWSPEKRKHYSRIRKKAIVRSDGKEYVCCADAARDLGVTYAAVSHVLRGTKPHCKGYTFRYK